MATKKISTGLIAMLLVALIICGGSADAAEAPPSIESQAPAEAPFRMESRSTVFYEVGMPLYRVRNKPDVLIPASKLDPSIKNDEQSP
ncbi:hypothetical protein ACOSQ3_033253 [Xanthoceras sorbifolium]